MPSTSNLIGFLLLAIVIIVVPGPSVLFAIGRALVLGTRLAVLSVLGNALGVGLQIILVALGLGVVIQQSPAVFFTIKVIGALTIAYLGIKAFADRSKLELADEATSSSSTVLKQSIVVGITNAKTFVFFVAALPSFVSPADGNPIVQMLFLGLIFSIIGIASDMVYAVSAGKARDWLSTSKQRLENFRGAGGIALALLGVYMLWDALTKP
ncbi:MAG: LysE family translocator [Pirellula sp.]|jgi:threonine/homoserine/homoserine lactone efflux protein